MKWLLLAMGIFFEIIALIFMKKSEGFTKLGPDLLVLLFYSMALGCLILVLRRMDTSIAYAIWASGGIMVMAIVGMVWLKEPISFIKIGSIALITIGVIGLELAE